MNKVSIPSIRERDFVAELDFHDGVADLSSHGNADLKHAISPAELNIAYLQAAGGADGAGRQFPGGNHHRDEVARSDRAVDRPALGVSAGLFSEHSLVELASHICMHAGMSMASKAAEILGCEMLKGVRWVTPVLSSRTRRCTSLCASQKSMCALGRPKMSCK